MKWVGWRTTLAPSDAAWLAPSLCLELVVTVMSISSINDLQRYTPVSNGWNTPSFGAQNISLCIKPHCGVERMETLGLFGSLMLISAGKRLGAVTSRGGPERGLYIACPPCPDRSMCTYRSKALTRSVRARCSSGRSWSRARVPHPHDTHTPPDSFLFIHRSSHEIIRPVVRNWALERSKDNLQLFSCDVRS